IAGAGMAAHLPGVLAGWTPLPVIGVPLASGALQGIDALLSIVQMPPGVPVACVGVGGARNAALLAAQMLGLKHEEIRAAFAQHRKDLAEA
ncbi:MAG: 5-(carboxyamino)imidazole ribonucleotide mutase, partial [Chloroflexota bacterium]|nr:5-(carboxyamino)imidazole ribonucleotide mutase [Chloroflexota bacterium]